MKKLFLFVLILSSLFACTKDDNREKFNPDKYPQKWQLMRMSGQIPNSETTGLDMKWQEYYLFNADSTFTKSREQDGELFAGSGTFRFKELSDGNYIELSYESENSIIGSCYSGLVETLWLKSDDLLAGTWLACDGPGLEYERIE